MMVVCALSESVLAIGLQALPDGDVLCEHDGGRQRPTPAWCRWGYACAASIAAEHQRGAMTSRRTNFQASAEPLGGGVQRSLSWMTYLLFGYVEIMWCVQSRRLWGKIWIMRCHSDIHWNPGETRPLNLWEKASQRIRELWEFWEQFS